MMKLYLSSILSLFFFATCSLNKSNRKSHPIDQLCLFVPDRYTSQGNFVSVIRNCNLGQDTGRKTCFILNNGADLGCISILQTNGRLVLLIDGQPINFYEYVTKKVLISDAEWTKIAENNLTLNIGNKLLQCSTQENELDSTVTFKFEMEPSYSHVPYIEGITISAKYGIREVFYFDGFATIRSMIDF